MKLKFEDFEDEKLSKNQQKVVRGGDDPIPPVDPGKSGTGGGGSSGGGAG
ncbi:rSAM-modified peptide [Flavobacterium sp.]